MGATQQMNEDDARRLLRTAYPLPASGSIAWRPWMERPAAHLRPRHALLATVIAAVVAVVIALPVGLTLALHRWPFASTPSGASSAGAACAPAKSGTRIEIDADGVTGF